MTKLNLAVPLQYNSYCPAWGNFNDYLVPSTIAVNVAAVITPALNIILKYTGYRHLNQRLQLDSISAFFMDPLLLRGVNFVALASYFLHLNDCAPPATERRQTNIRLALIELVKAGEKANLTKEQTHALTLLKDHSELIASSLSGQRASVNFIVFSANFLQKYFPEEKQLKDTDLLDKGQIESYVDALLEGISNNKIKVSSYERDLVDRLKNIFKLIK